jgi:hypothetical protein
MTNAVNLASAAGTGFAFRNRIINGAMEVDQRAATVTVNAAGPLYSVDRWAGTGETADGVFTLAKTAAGPAGFQASLKATVTTADASIGASQRYIIQHRIEGNNIADLAWGSASAKTVTLSFWVFSSLTGTFGGFLRNSAGNRNYVFSYTVSAANTWEYKTITIAGDTSGTWLTDTGIGIILAFSLGAGSSLVGTADVWSANNHQGPTGQTQLISTNGATFYLTGVQLEAGSVATPFERRLYTTELQLAQRYYQYWGGSTNQFQLRAYNLAGGGITQTFTYPVEMRTAPTVSIGTVTYSNASGLVIQGNERQGIMAIAVTANGDAYVTASGSNKITFSAEL